MKNIIKTLLVVMTLVFVLVAFTGCGECTHEGTTELIPSIIPTCTETGMTLGSKCTACGEVVLAPKEWEALGHDLTDASCTAAPTCKREGCDYVGELLAHQMEAVEAKEEGCENNPGYNAHTACAVCGYSEDKVLTTYGEDGGHTFAEEDMFVYVAPTCTEDGVYAGYCSTCGTGYLLGSVPATGHTYEEGVCTGCGEKEPSTDLVNAVLDCTTKDNRVSFSTEEQVWEQNGIKLTLKKGEGTDFSDKAPITFSSKGSLTIEAKGMKVLVIATGNTTYGTYVSNCFNGQEGVASVSASSGIVTVVFTEAIDSFTIESLAKQGQIKTITVNPAE